MLKKRSDTDIVTSLLIQWGNKLMNHLQKKVSETKTCWGELSIFLIVLGGHSLLLQWGSLCCASNGKLYLLLLYLYICLECYAQAGNQC